MQTRLVGYETSQQVWRRIQEFFEAHTRAKVQQYKIEFRNTKKGSQTINEYLLRIKALVDCLISIGHSVLNQEHIDVILEGLLKEYDVLVIVLTTQKDKYSLSEIESLLLNQEIRIEKALKTHDNVIVNLTTIARPSPTGQNATIESDMYFAHGSGQPNRSMSYKGRGGGGRFRGKGGRNRPQFTCQLCHRLGHAATTCYYHFDYYF